MKVINGWAIPDYNFESFIIESKVSLSLLDRVLQEYQSSYNESNEISLGFTYDAFDPVLDAILNNTIFNFNNESDRNNLIKLNAAFRGVNSFSNFYRIAQEITTVTYKEVLQTEYSTAIKIGMHLGLYHRLVSGRDIFPYWKYCASLCDIHKQLNGIVLPYHDIRWTKLFPIKTWGCYCDVRPLLPSQFKKLDTSSFEVILKKYLG